MKNSLLWDHSQETFEDCVKGSPTEVKMAKAVNAFVHNIISQMEKSNDGEVGTKVFLATLHLVGIVGTIESVCGIKSTVLVEKLINVSPNELVLFNSLEVILSVVDENYDGEIGLIIKQRGSDES